MAEQDKEDMEDNYQDTEEEDYVGNEEEDSVDMAGRMEYWLVLDRGGHPILVRQPLKAAVQ